MAPCTYFPDRIAVLQALATRNLDLVLRAIERAVADRRATGWREAVSAAFDAYVGAFRTQRGFASLRGGDVLDLRPAAAGPTANSRLAEVLLNGVAARFGTDSSAATLFAFENAVEVQDALIARAFARSPKGDAAFLESGRALVLSILSERLG